MRFCEQLNEYITRLDCRGKELAEAAGLSAPSLSRYRTGERTPGRGSAVLTALSDALADMAKAKALPDMDADTLYSAFLQCDEYAGTDRKMLRENFNALIEVMGSAWRSCAAAPTTIRPPSSASAGASVSRRSRSSSPPPWRPMFPGRWTAPPSGKWPPRCWAVSLKISATAPSTAGGCRIGCWAAMRPGRTASPAS